MKTNIQTLVLIGLLSVLLTACGGDSKSDSSGAEKNPTVKPKTKNVTPSTNPQTNSSGKIAEEWVKAHNKYRKMHQVGNVKWSVKIAKSAQAYADTCPVPPNHSKTSYGENMAWGGYGSDVKQAVARWYREEPKYNYNKGAYQSGAGHFTQIVWKGTTEIGCGYKTDCNNLRQYGGGVFVCQYNPAGNITNAGYFKANVLPKK